MPVFGQVDVSWEPSAFTFHLGAVALEATDPRRLGGPPNDLAQIIVDRGENVADARVFEPHFCSSTGGMAARAILRRDDHADRRAIMLLRAGVGRWIGLVAVVAIDALLNARERWAHSVTSAGLWPGRDTRYRRLPARPLVARRLRSPARAHRTCSASAAPAEKSRAGECRNEQARDKAHVFPFG